MLCHRSVAPYDVAFWFGTFVCVLYLRFESRPRRGETHRRYLSFFLEWLQRKQIRNWNLSSVTCWDQQVSDELLLNAWRYRLATVSVVEDHIVRYHTLSNLNRVHYNKAVHIETTVEDNSKVVSTKIWKSNYKANVFDDLISSGKAT